MYRVGFGDCFLVSLPSGSASKHLLIDCGVHQSGHIKTIRDVVENIGQETAGRLELVVATHRHQDHISGFGICEDLFSEIEVGEVWLPWTEDESNERASRLRKKRELLARGLQLHFARLAASGGTVPAGVVEVLQNITGLGLQASSSPWQTAAAMRVLQTGFSGPHRIRYLEAGLQLAKPSGIAGLSVRVLGPPTDEVFLRRMDPPSGAGYLDALTGSASGAPDNGPFPKDFVVERTRFPKGFSGLEEREESRLRDEIAAPLESLAFTLDQVVNNTSLVLVMTYRGKSMLFAGDAQWGSWESWVKGEDAKEILGHLSFYKVSHHGSRNATPPEAVAQMPEGRFAAMASTQSKPWSSIPREPLMEDLEIKTNHRVIRSDSLAIDGAPKGPPLKRLPKGFAKGRLWYDYTIGLEG